MPIGRRQTHPGEPTPEWGPMGRTGCIVFSAAVIVIMVVGLVIGATRAHAGSDAHGATAALMPSVSQQLSDETASIQPGGHVDLPEHGIALTFPDGWSVEPDPASGSHGSSDVFDAGMRELITPLVAAMPPTRHDRCVVADITQLVAAQPAWSTLDDVVSGYEQELATDTRWVGLKSRIVSLPAGFSGHIRRAVDSESETVSSWFFSGADTWFLLECVTHTHGGEQWRSIAKTFAFLPEDG